jgi:hypothetical protein
MTAFIDSIRNGFTGLPRFSGRDPARRFWPYVGVVIGLLFVTMAAALGSIMSGSFARLQRFAAEHPEQATATRVLAPIRSRFTAITPSSCPT